jgi:excisionase family DNA binding protein
MRKLDRDTMLVELPRLVAETPSSDVPALVTFLSSQVTVASSRLLQQGAPAPNGGSPTRADENLSVVEAARRLGMSKDYLYRKAGSLPFAVRIGRRILFSAKGLERWNRERQGHP